MIMQWLIELQTNDDPISTCRLLNIFRRKGLKLEALAMARRPGAFGLTAVVDFAESELGHIFSYLRRTEGVLGVNCYRQDSPAEASFVLVSADSDDASTGLVLDAFADAKLIFATQGTCLLEVPRGSRLPSALSGLEYVPFVRVMSSEDVARPEPVGAVTER